MRKFSDFLIEARRGKGLKVSDVSEMTKIKMQFITAIENEDWEKLPPFPVVVGFVKSIAHFLNINEREAVALLRRDYPIKPVVVAPKPDMETKFVWSPRKTFATGVILIVLVVAGYLGLSYRKFSSPPRLVVSEPKEGQTVTIGTLKVLGTTDVDATVKVNNQPALVSDQGDWSTDISVDKNTTSLTIEALSRSGKTTTINRKIQVQSK
ncbi:MAG TPA: helix-turn-helix domain-containing protein [Patescibacteria group bacterium]